MWLVFPAIWDAGRVLGNAAVLAHQGGWDEALMVIAPVGLFGGLLWVAYRRSAPTDAGSDRPGGDDGGGRS